MIKQLSVAAVMVLLPHPAVAECVSFTNADTVYNACDKCRRVTVQHFHVKALPGGHVGEVEKIRRYRVRADGFAKVEASRAARILGEGSCGTSGAGRAKSGN